MTQISIIHPLCIFGHIWAKGPKPGQRYCETCGKVIG